jgi:hypothetical protein
MSDHRTQNDGLPNTAALQSLKDITAQLHGLRTKMYVELLFVSFDREPEDSSFKRTRLGKIEERLREIECELVALDKEFEVKTVTTTQVVRK